MSAGKFNKFNEVFQATRALLNAPIEYRLDSKGRKVRIPNANQPVSAEEVKALFLNMRVLEEEEVLESLGKGVMDYMLKVGQLEKDGPLLWITKACAVAYSLPAYLGDRTFIY
jgi:hypothetical protein